MNLNITKPINVIKLFYSFNKALEELTIREKQIIEYRFGMNLSQTRTLEEVSKYFGVSRERIHQVEAVAFEKITNIIEKEYILIKIIKQIKI